MGPNRNHIHDQLYYCNVIDTFLEGACSTLYISVDVHIPLYMLKGLVLGEDFFISEWIPFSIFIRVKA